MTVRPEGCPRNFLCNRCVALKKVPGTFLKKSAALVIHRLKVLGTTNSLALRGFNTVDRVFFSCELNKIRACAVRPKINKETTMVKILTMCCSDYSEVVITRMGTLKIREETKRH